MKIIIVTGTPGCGKTTISIELTNFIRSRVISLNDLVISKNFIIKYDNIRDTYITDFKKLIPYIENLINKIKSEKLEVLIIEGHFADIIPNNLIDIVIILRCHPDVLNNRLKRRAYSKEKIHENLQAEILGNCSNFIFEKKLICPIYEIDTSNMNLSDLTNLILNIIEKKEPIEKYKLGNIDWLNELFNKNRLDEFFD